MNYDKLCSNYDFWMALCVISIIVSAIFFLIFAISLVIFINQKVYNSPKLHEKRNANKLLLIISTIVIAKGY